MSEPTVALRIIRDVDGNVIDTTLAVAESAVYDMMTIARLGPGTVMAMQINGRAPADG